MFKRRHTLDPHEKIKRNRQTELYSELDKCLQISSDDRLLIRKRIKEFDQEIVQLFEVHRKSKNYADLQIQLRKIIVMMKEQNRNPLLLSEYSHRQTEASKRMYSMKSQPTSIQNSIKESPLSRARDSNNKKTVIDFDITQLQRKLRRQLFSNAVTEGDQEVFKVSVCLSPQRKSIGNSNAQRQPLKLSNSNESRSGLVPTSSHVAITSRMIPNQSYSASIKQLLKSKLMKKKEKKLGDKDERGCRLRLFTDDCRAEDRLTGDALQQRMDKNNTQKTEESFGKFYQKIRNVIESDDN